MELQNNKSRGKFMIFEEKIKTLTNEELEAEYSKILKAGAGTRQSVKTGTRLHALELIIKEMDQREEKCMK